MDLALMVVVEEVDGNVVGLTTASNSAVIRT